MRNLVLHLTGGLGNQLFQYAAAISTNADTLEIETQLGKPRTNTEGVPDLFAFELPRISISKSNNSKFKWLSNRATGYALRSAVAPKRIEKLKLSSFLIEIAVSTVLLLNRRKCFHVTRGSGVGYSEIPNTKQNTYLIGYFQSYKYAGENKPNLMKIAPHRIGPELKMLIELSRLEIPLIVHFRLGDYLKESKFGIPGINYYTHAISKMWKSGKYMKIWVFSDDIELAKINFPQEMLSLVRWIEEVDCSPASTLHAMRYGHGYVIANSTFSWWGAFLSKTDNASVIAPSPWFKGMESPLELISPDWEILDSDF